MKNTCTISKVVIHGNSLLLAFTMKEHPLLMRPPFNEHIQDKSSGCTLQPADRLTRLRRNYPYWLCLFFGNISLVRGTFSQYKFFIFDRFFKSLVTHFLFFFVNVKLA